MDADRLKVETFDVRQAARGDEQVSADDFMGIIVGQPRVRTDGLAVPKRNAGHIRIQQERDPFAGEDRLEAVGDFGVFVGQDVCAIGDDFDISAETSERLRELDADRTRAEDDQGSRELVQRPKRLVVQRVGLAQTFDIRPVGSRAGGDDELAGVQGGLTVENERIVRLEHRRTVINVDPLGLQRFGRVGFGEAGDDRSDAVHDGGEIDLRRGNLDAEAAGALDFMGNLGREQRALLGTQAE